MEKSSFFWQNTLLKICIISALALLMLIPLSMIRRQIDERSQNHSQSVSDITHNWGTAQTFTGPWISYSYQVERDKEKGSVNHVLYPDSLRYVVNTAARELHRSIYDVSVFTADMIIEGQFTLDTNLEKADKTELILNMDDLKGIQGTPSFLLNGKELKINSGEKGLKAGFALGEDARPGDVISFTVKMKINCSESIFFRPVGNLTELELTSDYPDPSFGGDFLPVERDLRQDGFTARWLVSQITMDSPSSNSFGVRMVKPVTQYRQTERASKYGLLIIFLVFMAGFVVEIISKKPINIIQYLVIGASLVLFYSLLLAFSDFLAFGLSYLIASIMTTAALCAYFAAIVRNKWAFLLTGLVALSYGVIYVLLQMETFAFLAGTLLLFLILCLIMFLTRNLELDDPGLVGPAERPEQEPK